MGASSSSNIVNDITEIVTNSIESVVQTVDMSDSATNTIDIQAAKDIDITGLVQNATVTVDVQAMMDATNTQNIQQDMINSITTEAKSITSGLNFADFSSANNQINEFLSETANIVTNTNQICKGQVGASNTLVVDSTYGAVTVSNVEQSSSIQAIDSCIMNELSSTTSISSLQNAVDASASATTKGLDITTLLILIIVCLVLFAVIIIVPIAVGGNEVISLIAKLFFPLIFVTGAVFFILYFTEQTTVDKVYSFSKPIDDDTSCGAVAAGQPAELDDPNSLQSKLDKSNYVAAYWQGFDVTDSTSTPISPGMVTYYTSVKQNPCKLVESGDNTDSTQLVHYPNFYQGDISGDTDDIASIAKDASTGDAFLDTADTYGQMYFLDDNGTWEAQGRWISKFGTTVTFRNDVPAGSGSSGDYWFDYSNPTQVQAYTYNSSTAKWDEDGDPKTGPGYKSGWGTYYTKDGKARPNATNMAVFRQEVKPDWMLTVGIIMMVVGVLGFILGMTMDHWNKKGAGKKSSKDTPKPPKNS